MLALGDKERSDYHPLGPIISLSRSIESISEKLMRVLEGEEEEADSGLCASSDIDLATCC
jgi:hypothetical protein